jgi:hypothetical protein
LRSTVPVMFRSRGENLRSIFALLFLYVAFFLLEYQDAKKFAQLFTFDIGGVLDGQVWRLVTYQFTHSAQGVSLPAPLALFLTLILLHLFGSSTEAALGTRHFLSIFAISTLTTAGVAALLGVTLLGSYFVSPSLLFVYAALFPRQALHLFGVIAVPVRWLAYAAMFLLVMGAWAGGMTNIAALAGALVATAYAVALRTPVRMMASKTAKAPEVVAPSPESTGIRNAARYVAIKRAVVTRSHADVEKLIAQSDREKVQGVNICPPADYKPESNDGYCIRCDGFAECSARYLRLNAPAAPAAVVGEVVLSPES